MLDATVILQTFEEITLWLHASRNMYSMTFFYKLTNCHFNSVIITKNKSGWRIVASLIVLFKYHTDFKHVY